jgi:hypothetical protein
MATLQSAQAKWERKTANAGAKWKAKTTGKGGEYSAGIQRFLGVAPSATVVSSYEQGVAAVSAQDFQNAIAGKGAKWAENYRIGMTT